jgi:exosome complex component RRP42
VEAGEFEIDEESTDVKYINTSQVPVCVTFNKIGNAYVVDASLQEELCMSSRLTVSIDRGGVVCSIQKGGSGGVNPSLLSEMLNTARRVGVEVINKMDQALKHEQQQSGKRTKVGMFA